MTNSELQRDVPGGRPWFQFSLSTLLIATVPIGVCIGYAVRYGLGIGLIFGATMWWGCDSALRALRGWHTFGRLQRSKAIFEVGAFVTLFITFVAAVALFPPLVRQRSAWDVQRALRSDVRFSSVRIEYTGTPESWLLRVEGEVQSDLDFDALRTAISLFEGAKHSEITGQIYWDVKVVRSQREYKGWGYETLAISRR